MEIACEITVGLRSDGLVCGLLHPQHDAHCHSSKRAKSDCDRNEKPDCTEIEPIDRKQCADRAREQPDAVSQHDPHDASKALHGRVQCQPKAVKSINRTYDLKIPSANPDDFFIVARSE